MIDRSFGVAAGGSNRRTEMLAGTTTCLAMAGLAMAGLAMAGLALLSVVKYAFF